MSVEPKYKRFMEVKVVPLGGVPPVIYNFEFTLTTKIKDLKHELIALMIRHQQRVQDSLYGYLRCNDILSSDTGTHSIPSDVLHLCGSFYDAYYPMSINVNSQTLAVYRNLDQILSDENMEFLAQKQRHQDDQYYIYELMDVTRIHKKLKLDSTVQSIPSHRYSLIPIHHFSVDEYAKIGQPLLIKLPMDITISAEAVQQMIDAMIGQYLDEQFTERWKVDNGHKALYMVNIHGEQLSEMQSVRLHARDTSGKLISCVPKEETFSSATYRDIALPKHCVVIQSVPSFVTLSDLQTAVQQFVQKPIRTEMLAPNDGLRRAIIYCSNANDVDNVLANLYAVSDQLSGSLRTSCNYAQKEALLVVWNRNTQNIFRHRLFSHPHDTFDHLMSEQFEEDDTEQMSKIQSMFDTDSD